MENNLVYLSMGDMLKSSLKLEAVEAVKSIKSHKLLLFIDRCGYGSVKVEIVVNELDNDRRVHFILVCMQKCYLVCVGVSLLFYEMYGVQIVGLGEEWYRRLS